MKNNVTALTIVFNEEDWIWWCLKSVYPIVSRHIVIEGCTQATSEFSKSGKLRDGTESEIRRFMNEDDPENKIIYKKVGIVSCLNDLRQAALDNVPRNTNWCLNIDADQLYEPAELDAALSWASDKPWVVSIACEHLMFFKDMNHIVEVADKEKSGMIIKQFLFRWQPLLIYENEYLTLNGIWWEKLLRRGNKLVAEEAGFPIAVVEPMFKNYHFGWVHRTERIDEHILWWKLPPELEGIEMSREEREGWVHTYHKIYTGIYSESAGEELKEYIGGYPLGELIQSHPFWGKPSEWFGYGDV